jgi:hypothetical protein
MASVAVYDAHDVAELQPAAALAAFIAQGDFSDSMDSSFARQLPSPLFLECSPAESPPLTLLRPPS